MGRRRPHAALAQRRRRQAQSRLLQEDPRTKARTIGPTCTRACRSSAATCTHLVDLLGSIDAAEKAPKVAFTEPSPRSRPPAGTWSADRRSAASSATTSPASRPRGCRASTWRIMTRARSSRDWFHNYLLDPSKYRPGTRMPTSFPDGKTPLKKVLDGKADNADRGDLDLSRRRQEAAICRSA